MELQGDELSVNEVVGHGSEHAKPNPFPDALLGGKGLPRHTSETKNHLPLPSSVLRSLLETPVMFSPAPPHPLKLGQIPTYSRTWVELPKLKECPFSRVDYRLQIDL